ncbi:MAG: hypothetical protein BGO70_13690 [Bacteroidetes bacterium 43-93]|nr:hypothetical protein [Bacteroidota bacterium]OJW99487.1 MAG: hypothetical protein BGO70_13690 [Bacteroidetes bacterium 43-93]
MANRLSKRIANIQKQLGILPSGIVDAATCSHLAKHLGLPPDAHGAIIDIAHLQKALHIESDGIAGPQTITTLERLLAAQALRIPKNASLAIPRDKMGILLDAAVPQKEQYEHKFQSPYLSGADSGIIIGIGYDCGYASWKDINDTWEPYLSSAELSALIKTHGKTGDDAKKLLPAVIGIKILYHTALHVFYTHTLPDCAADVKNIFPGINTLLPDCQAALLSLVYNRGPLINDTDRRKEMKELVRVIAEKDYTGIAKQIKSMQRLWPKGSKQYNLREQEAYLIETARDYWLPEDIIML